MTAWRRAVGDAGAWPGPLNLSKSRAARGRYGAAMASFTIDLDTSPNLQFRIDKFDVPAAARAEFEAAVQRNTAFLQTLPGFRWHQVFEKTSGDSTFNLVTIAVWESPEAVENAVAAVRAYYAQIGFELREMVARLGITADVGNFYVGARS